MSLGNPLKPIRCYHIIIDGHSNVEEVTDIFANKNKILYNSVSYSKHDMDNLSANIDAHIENSSSLTDELGNHKYIITVQEVKDAIHQVKFGKREENGLYSNHFKYGTQRLYVMITLLFNCMLTHGIAPDDLLLGTMIPLIKK